MTIKTQSKTEQVFNACSFVREHNGEYSALGIGGTPEQIQDVYLTLFNSGATNGELLDNGNPEFAYVWVKPHVFAYRLAQWELSNLTLPKRDKLSATRTFHALFRKWQRFFGHIPREEFVMFDNNADFEVHGVGVSDGMFAPVQNEVAPPVSELDETESAELSIDLQLCSE